MRIHYRVSGEGIEIVRCFGTDSQVVIPEQIEGKPVIKAAPYAFSARKDKEEIDVQTYDTDQIGQRSAEEKLLAGDAVEEVVFPIPCGRSGVIFLWMQKLKKAGILGQSDADRKRSVYSVRKFTETDCSLAIWK